MQLLSKLAALALVGLLAAGCGAVPWNPQNNAGLTKADVHWNDDGSLKDASIIDGKEKQDVSLKVTLRDGSKVAYAASGVKAFDAFGFRAELEKVVAEKLGDVAPGVVETIVDLARSYSGLPAPPAR